MANELNNQPAHSGNYAGTEGITNVVDILVALTGVSPVTYNQEEAQNILNRSTPITGHMVASDGKVYNVVDIIQAIAAGGAIDYNRVVQKTIDMPVASADTNRYITVYQGKTNSSYTHGYIYECQKTANYTGTITFEPASLSGTQITCDADDFGKFIGQKMDNPEDVVSGTMEYNYASAIWRLIGKDSEGNVIVTRQVYQPDYESAGFTFTGTPEEGDMVEFECSITEESATYAWVHLTV